MAQLDRIIKSPSFRNSKRYPRFLKHIVEQTLLGRADLLKERLIGIEVFDRPSEYDPSIDPIVRVAAGELRKRLAQYYVEHSHESELRIHLATGSYVPEFHPPGSPAFQPTILAPTALEAPQLEASRMRAGRWGHTLTPALATVMLVVLAMIFVVAYRMRSANPIREFWKPFLSASQPPLLCLGDWAYMLNDGEKTNPTLSMVTASHEYLALGDVKAMNRISSALARAGETVLLASAHSTNFADLSRRPVILVGGGPNPWTMEEMKFLPLQLVRNFSPGVNGIVDQNNRSKLLWTVNFNQPLTAIPREYAIVARFHNPETSQLTLIAAGVGTNGEVAAGEFVSTPTYLKEFIKHAPRGWQDRNLEIVLETPMINGASGPTRIISTRLW